MQIFWVLFLRSVAMLIVSMQAATMLHATARLQMNLTAGRFAFFFVALCNIGEGKSSTGHWKHVIQEGSDWGRSSPIAVHTFAHFTRGYAIPTQRAITYQRKANPSTAQTRILFVDYVGVTWSFSLGTTSWTAVSTNRHFAHLHGNSITSLCETRIVVFGGYNEVYSNGHIKESQQKDPRLWLFNGENEVWTVLQNLPEGPQTRHSHKAFTQYKTESACQCKESLFVYGGISGSSQIYLEDFWELRCLDDRKMKYEWIQINTTTWPVHPLAHRHAFSVDRERIYWLTRNSEKAWILDVTTKKWASKVIESDCPKIAFTYSDQANMVYDKEHQLLIVQLQSSVLGVYDINTNQFHCAKVSGSFGTTYEKAPAKILLLKNMILLVAQMIPISLARLRLLVLGKEKLLHIVKRKQTHKAPSFRKINRSKKYPIFNGDARLVKISNTIWYLMVQEKQNLVMWRYENDYLRWTLHDPDQKPNTDKFLSWETMAYSATENNCVAIFGTDHLWIYSTRLRVWTRVLSIGNAPSKLTSYATMNSLKNGSLLLFGGTDKTLNSLWMATIDFKRMQATWKRMCCNSRQRSQEPAGQLHQWSSAIWNNTLYVYFLRTKSSCEMKTYTTQIGNGDVKWNVASIRKIMTPAESNTLKNICDTSSAAIGRFAFTTSHSDDLLIEDLSQMKFTIIKMASKNSSLDEKHLLVGSGNTVFKFATQFYASNSKKETDIVTLDIFKLSGCEPGTNSFDYILHPCRPCPIGQYSDHYGATDCSDCPPGLVTTTTGSTSLRNCTCPVGKCANGICIVQSDYTTQCICNRGFTGPSCKIPTTYLVIMGAVLAVVLFVVSLYCIKRLRKHKNMAKYTRAELEIAEETAAELSDIWSVDEKEVEFDRMIGEGSFGDVWTAQYRDQTVAVKVLKFTEQDCTNEQLQEFKDESELLRSIFHAHIVRFIGTGKTAGSKPFIVLEYMEEGSIRKELDDKYGDHPMEIELQVKYALHAAKGIRHLHRINRMHRDLKCDNLLVNKAGIVKVADLGLHQDRTQDQRRKRQKRSRNTCRRYGILQSSRNISRRSVQHCRRRLQLRNNVVGTDDRKTSLLREIRARIDKSRNPG